MAVEGNMAPQNMHSTPEDSSKSQQKNSEAS